MIGVDVRNMISFGDLHGKKPNRAGGVGMDYVQTGNYFERSMIVRYPHPHPRVKRESE
jgi:hypothetical protein